MEYVIHRESVRVHRLCRSLYPTATDDAAPRAPRGAGCPCAAAVENARIRASGYPRTAAGQLHSAARTPPGGHGAPASAQTSQQAVVGEGKVIAVVPSSSQIVVDHKEIPGFMEAMTMGYRVEPAVASWGGEGWGHDPLHH